MRHVITSLLTALALLVQGVVVASHVHPFAAAATAGEATANPAAQPGDDGSTPLQPSGPNALGCVFCHLVHASGACILDAAPAAITPLAAAPHVPPPAADAPRWRVRAKHAPPRGPPASSLTII